VPITDLSKHAMALKTHLLDLAKYYVYNSFQWYPKEKDEEREKGRESGRERGREYFESVSPDRPPAVTMINLIDKNGSQGKLGTMDLFWNFVVSIIAVSIIPNLLISFFVSFFTHCSFFSVL
jgi:hypothetical protein